MSPSIGETINRGNIMKELSYHKQDNLHLEFFFLMDCSLNTTLEPELMVNLKEILCPKYKLMMEWGTSYGDKLFTLRSDDATIFVHRNKIVFNFYKVEDYKYNYITEMREINTVFSDIFEKFEIGKRFKCHVLLRKPHNWIDPSLNQMFHFQTRIKEENHLLTRKNMTPSLKLMFRFKDTLDDDEGGDDSDGFYQVNMIKMMKEKKEIISFSVEYYMNDGEESEYLISYIQRKYLKMSELIIDLMTEQGMSFFGLSSYDPDEIYGEEEEKGEWE